VAGSRSQYNTRSDWLVLGHYSPIILTDRDIIKHLFISNSLLPQTLGLKGNSLT